MKRRKHHFKKGFTLVEVLITSVIIAIMSLAIYSVFANGVTIWRRGTESKTYERRLRINLEKMTGELRNTFKFSSIPFEGEEDSIKFPALISMAYNTEEEQIVYQSVGRIIYFYDKSEEALYKRTEDYAGVFNEKEDDEDEGALLISNVSELEFSFCYLDNATGNYKWKDDWKKEEQETIPQAVKINMVLERAGREREIEKIIFIPMGTGEQKIELGG